MGFIFGAGAAAKTPQELAKQREILDALMQQANPVPDTFGEGIYAALSGIGSKIRDKKLSKQEAGARDNATNQYGGVVSALMGGAPSVSTAGGYSPAPKPDLSVASADLGYGMTNSGPSGSQPIGAAPSGRVSSEPLGFGGGNTGGDALGLIREFEGFRTDPYWDVNALRTGYGSDTVTRADGSVQKVTEGTRVTREDADRDLQRRVETEFMPIAANAVGQETWANLAEPQRAALTSIAYNYGKLPESVAAAVQSGDPQAAASAIAALGSHNDGINAGRRKKEAEIFASAGSTPGLTVSTQNGPAVEGPPPATFGMSLPPPTMGQPAQPAPLPQSGIAQPAAPNMEIINSLASLVSDPYLPEGQRAVVEALLTQEMAKMQPQDPKAAIELERQRLGLQQDQIELDQLQNPEPEQVDYSTDLTPFTREDGTTGYGVMGKDGSFKEVDVPGQLADGAGGSMEYGLNPVLGRDKDGNTVVMQLGKNGTAVATTLPEGVVPDFGLKAFDTAQGSALGKGAGDAQVEAAIALPGNASMAGLINDQVEALKNDPYLPNMLGPIDSVLPNTSEDAARVQGKMDQLSGGAFLQARQMLKGGGAITDFESGRAEQAFIRMNAAQSVEDYKAALDEFNAAVQAGVKKLEAQAAGGAVPRPGTPTPPPPPAADVQGGFDAFAADPAAQAAAAKYGVTIEEMWAIKEGLE